MKCMDGLIWVGKSYWRILCSAKNSCAIPFKTGSRHCYVHEAEWRGCCRKVSSQPKWLIPGHSRIFLAHKDNLDNPKKGRILGYFHLARYETITQVVERIPIPPQSEKQIEKGKEQYRRGFHWDKTPLITERYEKGRWWPTNEPWMELDPKPECKEGSQRTKRCDDGSLIVTHIYSKGKWVPTGKRCPELPSLNDECEDGTVKIEFCDFGYRISHICRNGHWIPTNSPCPFPLPPNENIFEIERSCSLRIKPGSVYLVDALAAEITDYFHRELRKTALTQNYLDAKNNKERNSLLEEGRKLFQQVVEHIRSIRTPVTEIPDKLEGLAELRGELVFLKNPMIFKRSPRANFRGTMRVDGDYLIDQISKRVNNPVLESCDHSTKANLARELRINKAFAQRFIDSYQEQIETELKRKGRFKWPGFGIFTIRHRKETIARDPRTGKEIKVAAKNVVRFTPYKDLKEVAEKCHPPKKKK